MPVELVPITLVLRGIHVHTVTVHTSVWTERAFEGILDLFRPATSSTNHRQTDELVLLRGQRSRRRSMRYREKTGIWSEIQSVSLVWRYSWGIKRMCNWYSSFWTTYTDIRLARPWWALAFTDSYGDVKITT